MKIDRISIRNFTSFREIEIRTPQIAVIVGENDTGKTNIFRALHPFFVEPSRPLEKNLWHKHNADYNVNIPIEVSVSLRLDEEQYDELFNPCLLSLLGARSAGREVVTKVLSKENPVTITKHFLFGSPHSCADISWGKIALAKVTHERKSTEYLNVLNQHFLDEVGRQINSEKIDLIDNSYTKSEDVAGGGRESSGFDPVGYVGKRILEMLPRGRFVIVPAIRSLTEEKDERFTGISPAPDGTKIMNALFGLSTGSQQERRTFQIVKELFKEFFGLVIEGVSRDEQGRLIIEVNDGKKIFPLSSYGTGTQQALTVLYNMVVSPRHVVALDEPTAHFHPHRQRELMRAFRKLANMGNQIVLTTHSTIVVNNSSLSEIILLKKAEEEIVARQIKEPDELELEWRGAEPHVDPTKSEIFFARYVLVCEEPSTRMAINILAQDCGLNLDSLGVSVVDVGGCKGFKPILRLLKVFGIEGLIVRDADAKEDLTDLIDGNRVFSFSTDLEGAFGLERVVESLNDLYDLKLDATKLRNRIRPGTKLLGEIEATLSTRERREIKKPQLARSLAEKCKGESLPKDFEMLFEKIREVAGLR